MRYLAVVEYDGTDFCGFQRQARGRTVQAELETALGRIGWQGKAILGAGRTDAGVHAAGQVIAFDLEWRHGEDALRRALNANLPVDVAIKRVTTCAADFHPRYAARGRWYRYTIYNAPVRSPLAARYAWQVWMPALNVEAMQTASWQLLGRHDFAAFGSAPEKGGNTVRVLSRAEWQIEGQWLYFDVQADAFLYRMVRRMVGALKAVGAGELTANACVALLATRDCGRCPPPAPPQGLCLMEVIY